MNKTTVDTRLRERMVVLVTAEEKERISIAAANSGRDEHRMSNLVRRAVSELIERESLIDEKSEAA